MPYEVRKKGTKWVVVKLKRAGDGTTSTEEVGRHDSRAEANKQLAALHINVEDSRARSY